MSEKRELSRLAFFDTTPMRKGGIEYSGARLSLFYRNQRSLLNCVLGTMIAP
jgi:hypothetical protein